MHIHMRCICKAVIVGTFPPINLFTHLSDHLPRFVYLAMSPSSYLSVYQSIFLSIFVALKLYDGVCVCICIYTIHLAKGRAVYVSYIEHRVTRVLRAQLCPGKRALGTRATKAMGRVGA